MLVLNLMRELEMQRKEESETIKYWFYRTMVEKILVTTPERFESKIFALKECKDLFSILYAELLNELQAQGQRRLIGVEGGICEKCFTS